MDRVCGKSDVGFPAVLLGLLFWFWGVTADAQPALVDVRSTAEGAPVEEWRQSLEDQLTASGRQVFSDPVAFARRRYRAGVTPPRRVQVLQTVEDHLMAARQLAARLQEGPALARLAAARRVVEDHADVPGASAWLAEVETAIGIVAAQAGRAHLSEQAILRAVTLDPVRGIRSGEAPPAVVARAGRIARAALTAPTGTIEVRSSPDGARVYLDDALVGTAPQELRATSGRHVLRVEAPGYRPYGRAIEVLEGARPAHDVALAPDEPLAAAQRLGDALSRLDADAVGRFLTAAGLEEAWSLRLGSRPDRALVTLCWSAGCGQPARVASRTGLDIGRPRIPVDPAMLRGALRSGAQWLNQPAPFYARAWFWGLVGGVVVAAAAAVLIAVAVRPDPEQGRQLVINPMFVTTEE